LESRSTFSTGFDTLLEVVHAEIFKAGTSNGRVEVNAIVQRVNFNVRLGGRRQSSLGPFAGSAETAERSLVVRNVLAVATLKVLHEKFYHAVIKVFSTQVGISGCGLDFKDSFLNGQQGHVECTSTQVENKNILFFSLLVQTVGNGSGRRLVDDTEHVQAGNSTGVLGGLALGVIEIGRDSNNCVPVFFPK
jgi:NAD-specific glutamate dehydrogenase